MRLKIAPWSACKPRPEALSRLSRQQYNRHAAFIHPRAIRVNGVSGILLIDSRIYFPQPKVPPRPPLPPAPPRPRLLPGGPPNGGERGRKKPTPCPPPPPF